jgi:hypothetical protein
MTATTIRLPLSTHNRRQRAVYLLSQKNPIKQSVNFVRKSINEEEISKEEHSCEQSNLNIFRQASWAQDANSEMEDMWTLKRANSVFSVLDLDDDELDAEAELYASPTKRARTQVISWTDKVSEESSCLFFTSAVPSITAGGKLSPQKSVAPKCA